MLKNASLSISRPDLWSMATFATAPSPQNNGGRHRCRPPLSRRARPCRSSISRAGLFRGAETEAEAKVPRPPGSIHRPKPLSGFPAGSPTGPKPWRFAVGGFEAEASLPTLAGTAGRSPWFRVGRDPEPKPWFRLASPWAVRPWVIAGFAAPEPKPGPARPCRSRSFSRAGGGARTEVPLSAGLVLNPKVRCPACPVPWVRRPLVPMGASRSLPLSHKLKGKPAASAWRRLRQPPCLPLRSTIHPKAICRFRPGLWLGRRSPVAGRLSRPHPRSVTIVSAFQANSACG
jgi:hypothetical protein